MKRYVCIDVEMSEFTNDEKHLIQGIQREVIQIGAVMLDENYNLISKFNTYVKPAFSHITPMINELTGIKEEYLENADDFITAFDKYCYWVGDSEITTFCWSEMDYTQLWNELYAKAKHRTDLFKYLESFVDLQKSFCDILKAKKLVSLDSAVVLIKEDFLGQHHTADSDAYNTGCILHKLCCSEGLKPKFNFLNIALHEAEQKENEKNAKEYQNSFAAFMPSELLSMFGYNEDFSIGESCEDGYYFNDDGEKNLPLSENSKFEPQSPEEIICYKYKIPIDAFNSFEENIKFTDSMQVIA